jgi:hypothetical protein
MPLIHPPLPLFDEEREWKGVQFLKPLRLGQLWLKALEMMKVKEVMPGYHRRCVETGTTDVRETGRVYDDPPHQMLEIQEVFCSHWFP